MAFKDANGRITIDEVAAQKDVANIHAAIRDLQVKKLMDTHSVHSQALNSLIKALQESDSETEAHVQRTQKMGELLGRRIGLTDAQLSDLKLLCLLLQFCPFFYLRKLYLFVLKIPSQP